MKYLIKNLKTERLSIRLQAEESKSKKNRAMYNNALFFDLFIFIIQQ